MAKVKSAAKKKSAKSSDDSKASKLKSLKNNKKPAAKKPAKKEKSESLSAFQTSVTGRENGQEKPKIAKTVTKITHVSRVKIDKKGFLSVTTQKVESDASTTEVTESHKDRTAHPNLKAAFDNLRPHLALLCDYLSTQQIKDINDYDTDKVDTFEVRAISISDEGFVLSGMKSRKDGKKVILNTPYTLREEDDKTKYRYMDDLEEKVEALLIRVAKYQSGEEVGEAQQPELPFGDAGDKTEEIEDEMEMVESGVNEDAEDTEFSEHDE